MLFQTHAQRRILVHIRLLERRHIGGRRRRRRAEDLLQHPLAAHHGRSPRRHRGRQQHTPLPQHPAAWRTRRQLHALQLLPLHRRQAVQLRETLIHKREIRIQQFIDAPVLAHDRLEEHPRLLLHRIAQLAAELREFPRIDLDLIQPADLQPLAGKIPHKRPRTPVPQHPRHFTPQRVALRQLPLRREREERLIRQRRPQEIRQPRRHLIVIQIPHIARLQRIRVQLPSEKKSRRTKNRLHPHAHRLRERRLPRQRPVHQLPQPLQLRRRHRTPKRLRRKRPQQLPRHLPLRTRLRHFRKHPPETRRRLHLPHDRPGDIEAREENIPVPAHLRVRMILLVVIIQIRHRDPVLPALHRRLHLIARRLPRILHIESGRLRPIDRHRQLRRLRPRLLPIRAKAQRVIPIRAKLHHLKRTPLAIKPHHPATDWPHPFQVRRLHHLPPMRLHRRPLHISRQHARHDLLPRL